MDFEVSVSSANENSSDSGDASSRDAATLFAGPGDVRSIARELDWSRTALGPTINWSPALRTMARAIFDSPFPICLWSGPHYALVYNDAYRRILAAKHPVALGQPGSAVWAEIWAELQPQFDGVRTSGDTVYFEDAPFVMARLDGGGTETAWFNYSLSALRDEDGSVAAVLNITPETTGRVLLERRLAEEQAALRMSEERLRLVVEGAKDHVIFTTDPGGIITTWSAGAEAVLGWPAEEALGQSASMIFTQEDRAKGADVRELATAAREGCANDERWHLRRDGLQVFLNGSVHPLPHDADGQPRGFIKVARDETRRWQAQRDLEALNTTLEQQVTARTADRNRLWQLSADLMLVANFDGTIEAVNPAWTRVLGWSEAELVGMALFSLIHPDDLDHTISGAASISKGDTYTRFENRYRHKDGNYRDIVWATGPGDDRIIGVGRDATDEKARARALADAEQQLRQSQKMEAVGQLTGGLAHDFNNLLTAIIGGLELLSTRVTRGEYDKLERYVTIAQTGAQRAAALTQRLLAFSRQQALAPTPTDADRLIAGMQEILERTLGPEIEVRVISTTGLWPVLIDAPQLENAILNLGINARDAMPGGGQLTIETDNKRLDARAAADQGLPEGEYVALCVTDTGTGMPPDVIERVFDPFFTTKPIGKGTGLGLSMIYGFVRQSGGQVRVSSEVGNGTTMCLYLPRHSGDVAADDQMVEDADAAGAQPGETLLIVEDEIAIRQLVVERLTDAGYRVLEASTGPAGLRVLQSEERIDLLITDVGLPGGLNGRQVADAGRVVRPALKVLFVTGYAASAAVGAGHLDNGMEILAKPFNIVELEKRIRGMISNH